MTSSESSRYPTAEQASEGEEAPRTTQRGERPQGMVPGRQRRRTKVERGLMRLIATGGIVGLVIGLTSVILAALLWSSRQL